MNKRTKGVVRKAFGKAFDLAAKVVVGDPDPIRTMSGEGPVYKVAIHPKLNAKDKLRDSDNNKPTKEFSCERSDPQGHPILLDGDYPRGHQLATAGHAIQGYFTETLDDPQFPNFVRTPLLFLRDNSRILGSLAVIAATVVLGYTAMKHSAYEAEKEINNQTVAIKREADPEFGKPIEFSPAMYVFKITDDKTLDTTVYTRSYVDIVNDETGKNTQTSTNKPSSLENTVNNLFVPYVTPSERNTMKYIISKAGMNYRLSTSTEDNTSTK